MELREKIGDMAYLNWRISQLEEKIEYQHGVLKNQQLDFQNQMNQKNKELLELTNEIKAEVKPEQELWDGSDIVRNWKISVRLLNDWRKNGLIGFVQLGNKIWYPREARELFLMKNFNKPKEEVSNGKEK